MADRAVVFVDGNNWYHALRDAGVQAQGQLDYAKISRKLLGPRIWVGTRYYVGRLVQEENTTLYAEQRRFLDRLQATDGRITAHLGRMERRPARDRAARELARYLGALRTRIDRTVFHDLQKIASDHRRSDVYVEKAVDVMLAVDMVMMAHRDELDAAYLLSADGDFTPAVEALTGLGKKVYVASPAMGARLAGVATAYIRLEASWFEDCYRGN